MATVYRAYQPSMQREVAIKILSDELCSDSHFIQRFRREAVIVAKLDHPHILCVHECGEVNGQAYIVMPLLAGGDLRDLLRGKALPLDEISHIVGQVGSALEYAHAQGLIHRDVKPANILLDENGDCLLCDFGLVKDLIDDPGLTDSGVVLGTPAYMAPEQALGKEIDRRIDVYALGVILFEMAAGLNPFMGGTPVDIVRRHVINAVPAPRDHNPNLPEALERVIQTCLSKEPEQRYASAHELVEAVQVAIA